MQFGATETLRRVRALGLPRTVVQGFVEHGRKLGRTLGFPTANIRVPPGCQASRGVYATVSELADGRRVAGVASLGLNPTVPILEPRLEVWLFDFDEDLYGQFVRTELVAYLRPERAFESLDALKAQVVKDAELSRLIHRAPDPPSCLEPAQRTRRL